MTEVNRCISKHPRTLATCVCAVACAVTLAVPAVAFADDYATKQAEAEAAIQSLNNILAEVDAANEQYQAALAEQDEAEAKAEEAQATINEKTEEIEGYQEQLGTRARSMYRSGSSSFIDVLFGSTSFEDFATNLDLLNSLNQKDADMVANAKAAKEELEAAKKEYETQSKTAAAKAEEAAKVQAEANERAAAAQQTVTSLSEEARALLAAEATGGTQTQTVPTDQIVAFDETTGYATLADGTQARVVGYDSATGNAIVDLAMSFVGGSYAWGASDAANSTFDCSGLVQYVYAQSGINVGGHNDRAILNAGTAYDYSEAQPGDILWWDGHVAIYAGDGMMISADNEEYGITYREVSDGATVVRYGE